MKLINFAKRVFKRLYSINSQPIYVKFGRKKDLLIVDDIFPHPTSGFRYEEFNVLLSRYKKSRIAVAPLAYPVLNTSPNEHKKHINEWNILYPQLKNQLIKNSGIVNVNTKLLYCVFLHIIYSNIEWLEKMKIPFIFTLYPGGGFRINDETSDAKLKKVLSSPQFNGVIVTQKYTLDYLTEKNFCDCKKIEFIYGVVSPGNKFKKTDEQTKVIYPNKPTFDLVFCAAKYMIKGEDKGYDTFIELAHKLKKQFEFVRFHVIGGFQKQDIDVSLLEDSIHFYGYKKNSDLASVFSKMDVIVSPNKPFLLGNGAFDGFPLGSVVEAVLNGVVAIVTDELQQNTLFKDGEEIIITSLNLDSIEQQVINLIKAPSKLASISEKGRERFSEIYSNDYQMTPRIELLNNQINSLSR